MSGEILVGVLLPLFSPFAVVAGPRGLIEINSDVELEGSSREA